jgi:hypothetical protein
VKKKEMGFFLDTIPCILVEDVQCCGSICFTFTEMLISSISLKQNHSKTLKMEAPGIFNTLVALQGSAASQPRIQ